jgi:hypothetical protein
MSDDETFITRQSGRPILDSGLDTFNSCNDASSIVYVTFCLNVLRTLIVIFAEYEIQRSDFIRDYLVVNKNIRLIYKGSIPGPSE